MNSKKIGFYVVLAIIMVLSACGTNDQQGEKIIEKQKETSNEQVTKMQEEKNQQNPSVSSTNDLQEKKNPPVEKNNDAFRKIEVSGNKGNYIVKGEAKVLNGVFYYTVEDGNDYQVDETKVSLKNGSPTWEPFELTIFIPEDLLPQNGILTLELFERSANDNLINNQYIVKLDEIRN